MTEIKVNSAIKEALQENEKILWAGKSADFALVDSTTKSSLMLRWVISAVVALALLAAYMVAYAGTEVFQPLFIVVILAVAGFAIARPMMDRSALLKKIGYCITDKRALVSIGDDVFDLNRAGLKVRFTEAEDSRVHVALGSCADLAANKLRIKSLAPRRGKGDVVTGFVMYNVENAVRDFFVS